MASDISVFDPYAYGALAVYLGAAGGVGGALAFVQHTGRKAVFGALQRALEQAGQLGRAAFAPLTGGRYLVYAKGNAGEVGGPKDFALEPVKRAVLVKDHDGQTGLVISSGGQDRCVTGLGPMARLYAQLQAEGVDIQITFRDDEADRMGRLIRGLDAQEQQILGQWLMPEQEIVTDIVEEVDYEGALQTAGARGKAKLVVTNLRAALLAQTVQTEQFGNTRRVTTHYNLIGYLLPLAQKVTLTRRARLKQPEYSLELELEPEAAAKAGRAPKLKLSEEHAGLLLPVVLFRKPLVFVDTPPGAGIGETLSGLGWSCLFMVLGMGGGAALFANAAMFRNARSWQDRYLLPILIGAFVTPLLFRWLALQLTAAVRRAEQALG
ncbi:MAG: hypothetical protein AB7N76_26785 [Planctomycetota bacterium]